MAIIIYQVVLILKGTQAIQVLAGLFLLFLAYLVARQLEFFTLEWLLDGVVRSFLLIVIILFQADIRRVLSRMGRKALAPAERPGASSPWKRSAEAAETLASHRIGALIVLERHIGPLRLPGRGHQAGRPGHQGTAHLPVLAPQPHP